MPEADQVKAELKFHVQRSAFFKLTQYSRFLAELMLAVSDKKSSQSRPPPYKDPLGLGKTHSHIVSKFLNDNTDQSYRFTQTWSDDTAAAGSSQEAIMLARILYDTRELKRMAHVLKPFVSNDPSTPEQQTTCFLYNYALFMHGSQRKEEEIFERSKSKVYAGMKITESSIQNSQAKNIVGSLERSFQTGNLDDLNTYLLGLVYVELGKTELAVKAFVRALNINPCLWGAWQELSRLILQEEVKLDAVDLS